MRTKRQRSRSKQKQSRALEELFPAVQLTARVMAADLDDDSPDFSQQQFCEMFDVSDQTVRNWMHRGLPWRRGPMGKPRYPASASTSWALCWKVLESQRKAPEWLSIGRAINWQLQSQAKERNDECRPRDPDGDVWSDRFLPCFCLVPMEWDHPARERMLRLAARGTRPPGEEHELDFEMEFPGDVIAQVAGEWDTPLPRLNPSPPLPVSPAPHDAH